VPVIDFIGFFRLMRHRATLRGIGVQVVRRSSLRKTTVHAPFARNPIKRGRHRGANPLPVSVNSAPVSAFPPRGGS